MLFVGAGTTGTLMGCARYFREWHRPVRVVAVDSVGSVTFGDAAGPADDPGPGHERPPAAARRVLSSTKWSTSRRPDTIRACHRLARRGFLFGGSTGTVVSGAIALAGRARRTGLTAVAIAPDLGERYLDTDLPEPTGCGTSTARTC